jgi:putative addiction module killer protein
VATSERSVQYYYSAPAVAPFRNWRNGIADPKAKAAIDARVARLRGGNFSDSRPVGEGASESRIDFGPGYRIYYATVGKKILLLYGGDKATQSADIQIALGFWRDLKGRRKKKYVKK